MSTIKIFAMSDTDWVAAETLADAMVCCADFYDCTTVAEAVAYMDSPHEVSDEEMDTLVYTDDDKGVVVMRSFRQELERRILRGEAFPQLFGSVDS